MAPWSLLRPLPSVVLVSIAVVGCGAEVGIFDQEPVTDQHASVGSSYQAVDSFRLVDTRETRKMAAGETRCVQVAGEGAVDDSAHAVFANVTAVQADAPGHLVLFAEGSTRPKTSSLNYSAGRTVANGALVTVGSSGRICVYTLSPTHVIIDISGYFSNETEYRPIGPHRALDTRIGDAPAADSTTCLRVAGQDGVPADAAAVAINVTAVAPSGPGHLTHFPAGAPRPNTSALNYQEGQVVANGALVPVGSEGAICIYTKSSSHLVVDVTGYFPPSSAFIPLEPYRRVDTREGRSLSAGETRCFQVAGRDELPADATAVGINLVAVAPTDPGYLSVFPEGKAAGNYSSLNYGTGGATANNAIVQIGYGGSICVYSHSATNLIIDVSGYWVDGTTYKPANWDFNLTHRCISSLYPGQPNYFESRLDCPDPDRSWYVAVQAEATLQNSCSGHVTQSIPINAGQGVDFRWAGHKDEQGRANYQAILKTDFVTNSHPCGSGQYTWFDFYDQSIYGQIDPTKAVLQANVWYDDWAVGGGARAIAIFHGQFNGKAVVVEVDLSRNNWGDAYPGVADIVQVKNHPNLQWVELDGNALGLTIPKQQNAVITVQWPEILQNLIDRGYLIPPAGGLQAGTTQGMSLATEVRGTASAELRVSSFRSLSR